MKSLSLLAGRTVTVLTQSIGCHFNSFLTEMDEIIRTTTERGGQTLNGILIDGTFQFFMQLYTIHGTVDGH